MPKEQTAAKRLIRRRTPARPISRYRTKVLATSYGICRAVLPLGRAPYAPLSIRPGKQSPRRVAVSNGQGTVGALEQALNLLWRGSSSSLRPICAESTHVPVCPGSARSNTRIPRPIRPGTARFAAKAIRSRDLAYHPRAAPSPARDYILTQKSCERIASVRLQISRP